jgi:D-alanyl-D-alanine carboxypeptidase
VQDDLVGEANMGLWNGQRLKVIDLLHGSLLDSANDASMAIARYGGSKLAGKGNSVDKFVAEMNREAARLGLNDTNFTNPHGLDAPLHYSSAHDLAVAGWYALQNPTIAGIVRQDKVQLDGYYFANISNFIRRYPGANGVKPGETDEAGLCLVASANRFGHNVIAVLLNDPNLRTESDLLMDYSFSRILTFDEVRATPAPGKYLVPGYIGLPTEGKLEPYGAYVTDVQAQLKKALFFMYCANLIFGGNKP